MRPAKDMSEAFLANRTPSAFVLSSRRCQLADRRRTCDVARTLNTSATEVEAAFVRLGTKRLLVLEPGSSSKIRMAPPFSGIETPFPVVVGDKSFYANCVWDAFGIASALHEDAVVNASDAHTGEPITLEVQNSKPLPQDCVAHFAVPAARWWDNVIYT